MTSAQQPTALQAPATTPNTPASDAPQTGLRERLARTRPAPRHLVLAAALALSAVLNTNRLSQNGYANIFYSAGVKSMLRSWHNFIFVSSDPGGLITVDKPPLALWVQVASAKLFGFSPLSLLLPEAIAGVLAVALLYHLLIRRFGQFAALAGALALAVFPSFVAVSRDNGVDPLLILLMLLACAAGLRAVETGRWRPLLSCAVLVGLAFNTKTLAAYLVVPGIAVAYLLCTPLSIARRALQLLAAGLLLAAVSVCWLAFVDLTPASERPYVGSSTNNSEFGLAFEYNGLGRVEGQVGGPGQVPVRPGAIAHLVLPAPRPRRPVKRPAPSTRARSTPIAGKSTNRSKNTGTGTSTGKSTSRRATTRTSARVKAVKAASDSARAQNPIAFGGPTGPLRLFGVGLGDQGGWFLPFAFFGMLALASLTFTARGRRAASRSWAAPHGDPGQGALRGDPRLAGTLILGGWFLAEAAVLSLSKGIVHPYYVSALAPGAAAMAGIGAAAFIGFARGPRVDWRLVLAPCAIAGTVAAQLVLLNREHYMHWFIPILLAGAVAGALTLLLARRLAAPAIAFTFCLLLVAPTAYASTTWLAPVEGTFPAAGPTQAAGAGGVGVSPAHLRTYTAVIRYVNAHRPGSRWAVLADAAPTAAPFILLGENAGSLAGYSGTDPAIDGRGLARLIARGEARYVLLGGEFSTRGGNAATAAVLRACRQLRFSTWQDPNPSPNGLVLFDCAGRERELTAS